MSAPTPAPAPLATLPGDGRRPVLSMSSPLAAVLRRPPLAVPLGLPVREVLARMDAARVDCVAVVDEASGAPLGTFTHRDLVQRVVLPGGDLDSPVAAVMTGGLVTLEPETSAHQAALTMAHHGLRHLVVVDDAGRLAGLVTREDLFGLQGVGVEALGDRIQAAADLPALRAAAAAVRQMAEGLLAQGLGAETLTHYHSTLNDLLTIRAIEQAADQHPLPGVAWCWLALGSEGRMEQTFATDQDNALVIEADESDGEGLRRAFLPFARAVNEQLAACGIPRCPGNVMAGNARWCLTPGEWRRALQGWLDGEGPEALTDAPAFLDLRPVYGQLALAVRLRRRALAAVAERPVFLRRLTEAALQVRPPLGPFGFSFDRATPFRRTLDLKLAGSRLFSDAARILALAHGVPHAGTAPRLRALADKGYFDPETVAGLVDGFHFIHLLRLRNQRAARRPHVGPNRVFPRDLNALDRQVLKEALRQAQRLQACLVSEYQLQA